MFIEPTDALMSLHWDASYEGSLHGHPLTDAEVPGLAPMPWDAPKRCTSADHRVELQEVAGGGQGHERNGGPECEVIGEPPAFVVANHSKVIHGAGEHSWGS